MSATRERVVTIGALVVLWCLAGLSCQTSTGTYMVEDWVRPYWAEAQQRLVRAGHEGALSIHPSRFLFISHQPDCKITGYMWEVDQGRICVAGHFSTAGQIHYSVVQKDVVIHEAGHAILWALHKPDEVWRNWEHEK